MSNEIEIREYRELLRQIVEEKGFYGYLWRYKELTRAIIKETPYYEDLSEEGQLIIQKAMNLDQAGIKTISVLLYPKDEEEAENSNKTRIGFISTLIPCSASDLGYRQFIPFPEPERLNPLTEYVEFLSISLDMCKTHSHRDYNDNIVLRFKHEVKIFVEKYYIAQKFDGLLKLFGDTVVFDKTIFDVANPFLRAERREVGLKGAKAFYGVYLKTICQYKEFMHLRDRYKDFEELCNAVGYINLSNPQQDIVKLFVDEEIYLKLFSHINADTARSLTKEQVEALLTIVKDLETDVRKSPIPNVGKTGEWKKIIIEKLKEVKDLIAKSKVNSRPYELSDKMRLYMLKLVSNASLEGSNNRSQFDDIYAKILGTSANNVHTDSHRITQDMFASKKYDQYVETMSRIYNAIEGLSKDVKDRDVILSTITCDLIADKSSEKNSLEQLESVDWSNKKLKYRVKKAIEEQFKNQ